MANLTGQKQAVTEKCEVPGCKNVKHTVWEFWGHKLCSEHHLEASGAIFTDKVLGHVVGQWISKKSGATQGPRP